METEKGTLRKVQEAANQEFQRRFGAPEAQDILRLVDDVVDRKLADQPDKRVGGDFPEMEPEEFVVLLDDRPVVTGGGAGFPWSKMAFGYRLIVEAGETEEDPSTTLCRIFPGKIRMHGIGNRTLANEQDVALGASEEWVYVQFARGGSSGPASISHSFTEPVSTSTTVRIPLYVFERLNGGAYSLKQICNMGDVNFDTPIR